MYCTFKGTQTRKDDCFIADCEADSRNSWFSPRQRGLMIVCACYLKWLFARCFHNAWVWFNWGYEAGGFTFTFLWLCKLWIDHYDADPPHLSGTPRGNTITINRICLNDVCLCWDGFHMHVLTHLCLLCFHIMPAICTSLNNSSSDGQTASFISSGSSSCPHVLKSDKSCEMIITELRLKLEAS